MPTYEYQCTKGHAFEVQQKISEKAKSKCPVCGAKASRIISGGAGLIFKGSGFYITDYGKDGKGARKDGGSGEPAAAASASASAPAPSASGDGAAKPSPSPEVAKPPKKKSAEKAAE